MSTSIKHCSHNSHGHFFVSELAVSVSDRGQFPSSRLQQQDFIFYMSVSSFHEEDVSATKADSLEPTGKKKMFSLPTERQRVTKKKKGLRKAVTHKSPSFYMSRGGLFYFISVRRVHSLCRAFCRLDFILLVQTFFSLSLIGCTRGTSSAGNWT